MRCDIKLAIIIAAIVFLCAAGAVTRSAERAHARGPDCPFSWPGEPGEQFFSDSEGVEWFTIRSADSNGYETVRAYRADDRYTIGYVPGSPDETCYLLVRQPGSAEDLPESRQVRFLAEREAEPEESAPTVSSTKFRRFYDRLIPVGPHGPNPDPVWGDLFPVFSGAERSCITDQLGAARLPDPAASSVFHEGDEPRLQDIIILGCLSSDTGGALTFAMTFAQIVRQMEASGEENACVQEVLEPAVAALSNPSPTEGESLAILAFFFGLVACGLEAVDVPPGAPGG